MSTFVVVIRHGERLDEVDTGEWRRIRTRETQYDPPLTEQGWMQARHAGKELAAKLERRPIAVIYSSPTARTFSTAAAVASELSVSSIKPAYALNCCAAAKKCGVGSVFFARRPGPDTLGNVSLSEWPPIGDIAAIDKGWHHDYGFVKGVKGLASAHAIDEVIVLVTHREGIWELQDHIGDRSRCDYCSLHLCSYEHGSGSLLPWDSMKGLGRADKVAPGPAASAPNTVMEALERGSGPIVIHRGGDGASVTMLWRTPGVRGDWVDNGAVPDGEVVELLSSPQPSENDEGEFVFVQRPSGVKGWTKVKNVQLVCKPTTTAGQTRV